MCIFEIQIGGLIMKDILGMLFAEDNFPDIGSIKKADDGTLILKEQDISTLTLLYSGLSVKSIAFYLRITEPALRTRKTRYKHFFEENPTPSSAEFIQRLSNGDSSLRSE